MLKQNLDCNNLKPIDIENELKKYVFGQDEYLKKLSVFACKHMDNIRFVKQGAEPINNNLLVVGGSGCGKTYALKQLAKLIDVPFIEVDGSALQSNNYRGQMHARSIFNEALQRYGTERVKKSILFIDEFDKTLDVYALNTTGSHMVQRDLLKLFENGPKYPVGDIDGRGINVGLEEVGFLDTRAISIVCAGSYAESYYAYQGDEKQEVNNKIGFDVNNNLEKPKNNKKTLDAEDLIRLGNLPELIGRFSTIVNVNSLTKEDMVNILTSAKGTTLGKYIDALSLSNVSTKFSTEFCKKIVDYVQDDNTGFRGADKILNHVFETVIYDVKNNSNINKVYLDCINNDVTVTYKFSNSPRHLKSVIDLSKFKTKSSLNKNRTSYSIRTLV